MITVETIPVRMTALQWHRPGDDCDQLVTSYRHGEETRYGVHSAKGMQRVTPGDWIVFDRGSAQVFSPGEFKQKFRIVEEEGNQS